MGLPVDNNNGNAIADNPNVVFENLSYGGLDTNGNWKPYYYTTLECDKYGLDADSKLSSSQTAKDGSTDPKVTSSVDIEFKLDVSSYKETGTDTRKHINIKVVQNNQVVTKDINGKYLRVTIDGVDYYASNSLANTPTKGVIVIPVSSSTNEITCTVHDLPYAPAKADGSFDTDNKYTYEVRRCKAGGADHGTPLSFVKYDGNKDYSITENQTPEITKVTYDKTWSEYAIDAGLKPDKLHLRLFRTIAGDNSNNAGEVNQNLYSDINVDLSDLVHDAQKEVYTFKGTVDNLLAGKVVQTDGVGIWRKYTYFFKEYYDSGLTEKKSGSTSYDQFTQTRREDKPFVMSADKKTASLFEGINNKLITTKHDVTKKWIDNDDESDDDGGSTKPENRKDFYVVLQRRAGVEGEWENVDLNKTSVQSVNSAGDAAEYTSGEIQTVGSGADVYTVLKVEKNQLHIRFDQLSYCDEKGAPYQYRAAEVKIGDQTIREDNITLFIVPGTEPTDEEYSYVRIIHRGSNNYIRKSKMLSRRHFLLISRRISIRLILPLTNGQLHL